MRRKHNRRLLRSSNGHHLKIPRHVPQTIRNITDHLTREPLIAIRIRQRESNAITRMRDDGPIPPIPTTRSTVQGICTTRCCCRRILVGENMVSLPINHERAVFNSVCVSAWYAAEVRMLFILEAPVSLSSPLTHVPKSKARKTYKGVISSIIKAPHNIPLNPTCIINKQIRDTRPIRDEISSDIDALNHVFPIAVWTCTAPSNRRVPRRARQHLTRNLRACKRIRSTEKSSQCCRLRRGAHLPNFAIATKSYRKKSFDRT